MDINYGECVFCDIVRGKAPAEIVSQTLEMLAFKPLNPVTPGHTLVVPFEHVRDAVDKPHVTGKTMAYASRVALEQRLTPCNIITSVGREATQSVFHLHIHIVPRSSEDGIALPWP